MPPKSKTGLTSVSLFSGAGGMDVGVKAAGFEVLFANDVDPEACETYRLNHPDLIFEGDLLEAYPLLNRFKNVDLLFGGPPCQGFSVAGKMDPHDSRNDLISAFFDSVDRAQPKAFICENVKALATLSRWKHVRQSLIRRGSIDYVVQLRVLNSRNFGVPQNRERMFLVGVRRDLLRDREAEFDCLLDQSLHLQRAQSAPLKDVISGFGRAGSSTNPRICKAKITFAKDPVLRRSPYAGMLFNGAGRPLDPNGGSSTLPASMGGNKTPIVDEDQIFNGAESFVVKYHAHLMRGGAPYSGEAPRNLRRLTIDECLAIQTFPNDYKLSGSLSAMYRQIGNAVPCRLAEVVATAVRDLIACVSHKSGLARLTLAAE